jgi:transmembrane sensor
MLEKEIIDRFFQGIATREEIERIAEYIYSEAADKDLKVVLEEEFAKSHNVDSFDIKNNFKKISNKISHAGNYSQRKQIGWWPVFKVAAAILLVVGFSYLFIQPRINQQETIQFAEPTKTITKSTEKGQKLRLALPDGSFVVLNSLSSIEYAKEFEEGHRSVMLMGEAFFEVKNNSSRPFTIYFGESRAHVLGTSFNINCRDPQRSIVALAEGKLKVENPMGVDEIIHPGEVIKFTGTSFEKGTFDYQNTIGWKDGWLNFENNNMPQIREIIEMWYGVEMEIVGSPDKIYHYSGRYRNKTLKEVLEGISYVMNFSYTLKNDKVTVFFQSK